MKIGKILKPSACCDFLSVNIETALVAPLNGRVMTMPWIGPIKVNQKRVFSGLKFGNL